LTVSTVGACSVKLIRIMIEKAGVYSLTG
jgi:hypothetical protein